MPGPLRFSGCCAFLAAIIVAAGLWTRIEAGEATPISQPAPPPATDVPPAGLDHPAIPLLAVAPVFPPGETTQQSVKVLIAVGSDGKVSNAFIEGASRDAYARAALEAARRFVFAPAIKGAKPIFSEHKTTVEFNARSPRRVFPGAYSEIAPRIAASIAERFPAVVPLPSVGGFLIVGEPVMLGDTQSNVALLVRAGEADATSTWVVVSASALLGPAPDAPCDCYRWDPQEDKAQQFASWLAEKLALTPLESSYLARSSVTSIPSGQPEPRTAGDWSRGAIRRVLVATLPRNETQGKRKSRSGPPAVASLPAPFVLPTEAELLESDGTKNLSSDFDPPVRIKKVNPIYPEEARRRRVQGRVILQATIDTDGNVAEVKVLDGKPELNAAAMAAACCWKYEPARQGGKPVLIYFTIQVEFTLDGQRKLK